MIETHSITWRTVSEWAASELSRLKDLLCQNLDATQTATIRGEIRSLDALLKLPLARPDQTEPEIGGVSAPEV
jgi:hypothetical protein